MGSKGQLTRDSSSWIKVEIVGLWFTWRSWDWSWGKHSRQERRFQEEALVNTREVHVRGNILIRISICLWSKSLQACSSEFLWERERNRSREWEIREYLEVDTFGVRVSLFFSYLLLLPCKPIGMWSVVSDALYDHAGGVFRSSIELGDRKVLTGCTR